MSFKLNVLAAVIVGFATLTTAGAVFASPATVTTNVNVRSGPGPSFEIVDMIKRGEFVDLVGCEGRWCYIDRQSLEGWVSADYLSLSTVSPQPLVGVDFGFGAPAIPSYRYSNSDYPDQDGYDDDWGGRRSWGNGSDWDSDGSWERHHRPREW